MSKNKTLLFIILGLFVLFSFNLNSYAFAEEDSGSENTLSEQEDNSSSEDEDETETEDDDKDRNKNKERENYREKMREQWLEKKEQFKEEQEERKSRLLEKKEEVIAKRCEEVLERIEKRLENYNENKETHIENYARLYEKLNDIADKLSVKGYDVSKLESDLVTLDVLVKEYASAYSAFIGKLENAQEYTCGESEGMFKQLLQESKDQLKIAMEKRHAIREFYVNTLRKDIQEIRMQQLESSYTNERNKND